MSNNNLAERLANLPPMDVPSRLPKLREALFGGDAPTADQCDTFIVTNLTNIRWLSGFSGSAGILVVSENTCVLITDGRYAVQAPEETATTATEVRIAQRGGQQNELLKEAVLGNRSKASAKQNPKVGLEAEHISWERQQTLSQEFNDLVPIKGVIEKLRRSKDHGEIARIEAAAAIADAALAAMLPKLADTSTSMTEQDFAADLDREFRRLGASDSAFPTIVAAGSNGARPHAQPGPRTIQPGELTVIDSGAVVDGYRSDMTRTVSVGKPSEVAQQMWQVVQESQQAGVDAVKAGATTGEIDKICRDIINNAGWGEAFMHSTGHGVGLDIHEIPAVSANTEEILQVGEVITVEPGIYLGEHGGVRIEDTVSVTSAGCRPLTKTPKVLVI